MGLGTRRKKFTENLIMGFVLLLMGFIAMIYFDVSGFMVEKFSAESLMTLALQGFVVGFFCGFGFDEGLSELFAGGILLLFPIVLILSLLGGGGAESASLSEALESLARGLSWSSFLIGLAIGIHSATWILQGYNKLKSGGRKRGG